MNIPKVLVLKRLGTNRIHIRFEDNVEGILCFTLKFLNSSTFVRPLKKLKNFKNFHIEDGHTLMWTNGFGLGIIDIHEAFKKHRIVKF